MSEIIVSVLTKTALVILVMAVVRRLKFSAGNL